MMMRPRLLVTTCFVALPLVAVASPAGATTPPPPEPAPAYTAPPSAGALTPPPPVYGAAPPPVGVPTPPPEKHLGVGYKIGNGIGFVGADVIVAPVPHLALDLQANYASVDTSSGTAKGYGIAPSVQGSLFAGQVNTPYLGVGFVHIKLSLADVTATGSGFFVNAGYEWRWTSGLGILLGGGVAHVGSIHASNGIDSIDAAGFTHFNLEAGLRFMFL